MSTDTSRFGGPPASTDAWVGSVWESTRTVAFWLAVALPLAYLPALTLATPVFADPIVLISTVIANLVALIVGHSHEPSLGRLSRRG